MIRRSLTIGVLLVVSLNSQAQSGGKGSHAVLENAAKTIGADGLKSIKYSGNGFNFALGQSPRPFAPWPKFNVKSYTRTINYDTASSQEEMVRTQYENPPHGGGAQPIIGEQRQIQLVSGMLAGGSELAGKAAVIDVPVGKGHVVMFAANPMWRHQTQGAFFMLFNAALNFDNLGVGRPEAPPRPQQPATGN